MKEQIKEKLSELKKQIDILEWDDKRIQINPYKKYQLTKLKREYEELQEKLNQKPKTPVIKWKKNM